MDLLKKNAHNTNMKRHINNDLIRWKNTPGKKPLVMKGARQVGKTWSLKYFGQSEYASKDAGFHYIDFRQARDLYSIFDDTFKPSEILKLLEFRLDITIDPQNDLVIFDEIQECPKAVTSFKYFQQDMPELDIIGAGSHLGLLKDEESFPVGKVDFLQMFPMTFIEFISEVAPAAAEELISYKMDKPFPQIVHEQLLNLLLCYIFTGGMPEVVSYFKDYWKSDITKAIEGTRNIQSALVEGYRSDFTKYSGLINANHINNVFESIPIQLSATHDMEVPKYKFKDVIPRRKGFENIRGPLEWLQKARLCIKSHIAKQAGHPLLSYCDDNKFKVYMFDIGILNCMLNTPGEAILDKGMGPFKGFIVENFVAQEIYARTNNNLICWQEGNSEIEFLITDKADIIPLEVKSTNRSRRAKSLYSYINRYSPTQSYKLTSQNYGENKEYGFKTLPLYCCGKLT